MLFRSGRGDRSIDHRRTETLRRFLSTQGQSLVVTDFPEDYRPGDIVTYHRPQNRASTAHIAIVADAMAPSGRPYIIHNRGWGVQLEDALFVNRITGHYRFRSLRRELVAGVATPAEPASGPSKVMTAKAASARPSLCQASYPADVRARIEPLCAPRVAGSSLVE